MLDFGYYNADCVGGMKKLEDKSVDLAIVDPPYGIGYDSAAAKSGGQRSKNGAALKRIYHTSDWDTEPPDDEYFKELFRVSKNQIIWGGTTLNNYRPQKGLSYGINA